VHRSCLYARRLQRAHVAASSHSAAGMGRPQAGAWIAAGWVGGVGPSWPEHACHHEQAGCEAILFSSFYRLAGSANAGCLAGSDQAHRVGSARSSRRAAHRQRDSKRGRVEGKPLAVPSPSGADVPTFRCWRPVTKPRRQMSSAQPAATAAPIRGAGDGEPLQRDEAARGGDQNRPHHGRRAGAPAPCGRAGAKPSYRLISLRRSTGPPPYTPCRKRHTRTLTPR